MLKSTQHYLCRVPVRLLARAAWRRQTWRDLRWLSCQRWYDSSTSRSQRWSLSRASERSRPTWKHNRVYAESTIRRHLSRVYTGIHVARIQVVSTCIPCRCLHVSCIITSWRRSTVVERWSLTGELSLSCAWLLAGRMITLWVRRPL